MTHTDPALIAATATIVAAVLYQDMPDTPPLPRLIAEVKRDLLADPAVVFAPAEVVGEHEEI